MERKYHPIIASPHKYEITFFSFSHSLDGSAESFIDLHLAKNGEVKKLRFWSPKDLEIEKGFPRATGGMYIEDVSSFQLEGIKIHVGDFEASNGGVTFWARDVEEIFER